MIEAGVFVGLFHVRRPVLRMQEHPNAFGFRPKIGTY